MPGKKEKKPVGILKQPSSKIESAEKKAEPSQMSTSLLGGIQMIAGSKPKKAKQMEQTVLEGIEIISQRPESPEQPFELKNKFKIDIVASPQFQKEEMKSERTEQSQGSAKHIWESPSNILEEQNSLKKVDSQ